MRVGVVTGEVAVTVGATAEGMVAGDAVNTAARVQSAAEPGQVWVDDDDPRSSAAAAITFDDTGEHALKGKAEPVRLWAARAVVAAVGGAQRVDGLEAPLTGRDAELRLVKELFHAHRGVAPPDGWSSSTARPGSASRGWPGSSRSTSTGWPATVRWHRGRCLSYGEGVAFWALAEAVRARLGLVEADTGAVVADAARRRPAASASPTRPSGSGCARGWPSLLGAETRGRSPARTCSRRGRPSWSGSAATTRWCWWSTTPSTPTTGCWTSSTTCSATARAPIFVLASPAPSLAGAPARPRRAGAPPSLHLEPLADDDMASLVDGLVGGLPAATCVASWWSAPRASRCSPSRPCARSSTATWSSRGGPVRPGGRRRGWT